MKGRHLYRAQFLFRSRDHGRLGIAFAGSHDQNDPEKQKQEESGGVTVTIPDAETHTTIYSIMNRRATREK